MTNVAPALSAQSGPPSYDQCGQKTPEQPPAPSVPVAMMVGQPAPMMPTMVMVSLKVILRSQSYFLTNSNSHINQQWLLILI